MRAGFEWISMCQEGVNVCKWEGNDGGPKEMLLSYPVSPDVGRLSSFHSRDVRAADYQENQQSIRGIHIKEYEGRVFCSDTKVIG